ncbi:MAG: 5-formyltetrahydrofolate cyclo-ligase [Deltaproteobacteria bacterium]|nr:5-formyltetrahydrofolate cyclo-ligase [Deltaproteobacteria bacterium]
MQNPSTKELLRKTLLEARRAMSFEEVYSLSSKVQKRLLSTPWFRSARRLSLYSSFQNEVLTDDILKGALKADKEAYYPLAVKGKRRLEFFRVEGIEDLMPGSYDIAEPRGKEEKRAPEAFDLIVVPGVAFDSEGGRLGFGKGYYDRLLKGLGCPIVALAYEFQVLKDRIPSEPHDVRVSAIVTEKRIIKNFSTC